MKKFFFFILFLFLFMTSAGLADPENFLYLGYKNLEDGKPAEAIPLFVSAEASSDQELMEYVHYGLAKAEYDNKNYKESSENFLKFIKTYPGSVLSEKASYYYFDSFVNLGEYQKAVKESDNFFKKYPDSIYAPRILYSKALMLLADKKPKQAYAVFNEVDLYYPLSSYAKKARVQMKQVSKKHKIKNAKSDPKRLFAKGKSYFDSGDYESASAVFNRLAMLFPKHKLTSKAFLLMGVADLEKGSSDSSIKNIEKSIKYSSEKDMGESLYYLGRANGKKGIYPRAAKIMERVANEYPRSEYADNALYYLGIYYEKMDSPKAALNSYLRIITDYPKSNYAPDAILKVGHIYYLAGDYDSSYKIYSQAMNAPAGKETPQCMFWWGKTAEKLGKKEAAAGIYYFVAERYDHTFQSYRARDQLKKLGYVTPSEKISFKNALASSEIDEEKIEGVMDRWQKKNVHLLNDQEISQRLSKYRKLIEADLVDFAVMEAKEVLSRTEGTKKDSAQKTLAKIMQKSGEYNAPIRYVEKKISRSVLDGTAWQIPLEDWQLSYPKGFWDKVYSASIKYGVDPYLTLAVIREESRFNPKALSRSKAYGLMQIIPSTGKIIAKQLEIRPFRSSKMYNTDTNIEMGTYYLSGLIKRFDGNLALALAGYNGGPARVKRWVNAWYDGDNVNLDVDEFIQKIPLYETRYYVQKVLGSYYEYKRLYDRR